MKVRIGILIFLVVFLAQSISLPRVGMTWDEPSSFFFGRANLHFWLTRDRSYITDFTNPTKFSDDPFQYIYGEDLYPPFSFLVASGFSYLFAEKLHILSTLTAHHMGLVLLGALGIAALYGIAISIGLSVVSSVGVALLAATYPTIVGQMRNDAKDVPLMAMICIAVFFFLRFIHAVRAGDHKKQALFGFLTAISFGLMEATKVSGAIMVPILLGWIFVSWIVFPSFRKKMKPLPVRFLQAGLFSAVSLGVFFFIWPWIWDNPVGKLTQVWNFFKVVGYNMPTLYFGTLYHAGVNLPQIYPFSILAIQTPPILIGLFFLGTIFSFIRLVKKRDPFLLLAFFWIVIGMGRYFLQGVIIYAKIRHFIDVMPAFFLVMGVFFDAAGKIRLPKVFSGVNLGLLFIVVSLAHQIIIIFQFFPYEPSYFNILAGGTKVVADKRLFDIEYWASGIKEAMEYIESSEVGKNTTVYACTMGHLARFYETKNVKVVGTPGAGAYSLVPNSASWFGLPYRFMMQNHQLAYTIKRNGAELFYVFKHQSGNVWFCGWETQMVYPLQ